MFKTKAQRVRIVTEAFAGLGIVGRPGEIWVVESGVEMPQALQQNSEDYGGDVPHTAIRHDTAAHAVYEKLNAARPELPVTAWWDEAAVKKYLGWSDRQFAAAKASGFPQSNGRRDRFDRDGVPAGSEPLWTSELVQNWAQSIRTLAVSGR